MKKLLLILCLAEIIPLLAISQTNTNDMLEKFTSRPAEDILLDLYALKVRERDGEKIEQPLITLLLGGNRTPVRGFLIDLKNELKEKGVVIKLQDSNDVLFVEMYAVAGIAIHEADRVVPLLVSLTPADVASLPSVTKLDIKKQLSEESTRLATHFGNITISFNEEISTNPAELYFTKLFLTDLAMTLITIGKTDMGKEAIKSEVKTIHITRGPDLQIKREKETLTISYPFNKSYTTNRERQMLIDKIYDVL